jgi:hypothetical protein
MDPDVNALLMTGATALVQRMAADGWDQARTRLAHFFARGRTEAEPEDAAVARVSRELDESRADLLAAQGSGDTDAVDDVQAAWRTRLRRTLRDRPGLAAELRDLIDELTPPDTRGRGDTYHVVNKIEGGVHHGPTIMAGHIDNLHQGTPPPGQPRR